MTTPERQVPQQTHAHEEYDTRAHDAEQPVRLYASPPLPVHTPRTGVRLPAHPTAHAYRQASIYQMQQTHGNRYMQRVIQRGWLDTAWSATKAVGQGIYSVGEDLVGGAERTVRGLNVFDPEELANIGDQNARAFNLIRQIVSEPETLEQMVSFVIEDLYEALPEEQKARARAAMESAAVTGAAYLVGRMVIGKQIATALARRIATRIAATPAFRLLATRLGVSAGAGATGIGLPITLLMIQGTLERASDASERLRDEYPQLYRSLSVHGFDMAWFLIEPSLEDIRAQLMEHIDSL